MAIPIRQLLSVTSYAANGLDTVWNFSFSGGYIDKAHVKAFYVGADMIRHDVNVTESMFIGPYQLLLSPAIPADSTLSIYRDTPKTGPLVVYADKSSFTEASLDLSNKQAIFAAAEAYDGIVTGAPITEAGAQAIAALAAASAADAQASAVAAAATAATIGDVSTLAAAAAAATTAANNATAAANAAGAVPSVTLIPDFQLDNTSPVNAGGDSSALFPTTSGSWNTAAGSMYLRFEFISNNYFTANPGGHAAVILRHKYDAGGLNQGGGIIINNVFGATDGTDVYPGMQIEDFNAGTLPSPRRWLIPGSDLSRSKKMQENVRYLIEVWKDRTTEGINEVRYKLSRLNANGFDWDVEKDTGYCRVDANDSTDFTATDLRFAEVFSVGGTTWALLFKNIKVVWGPKQSSGVDATTYLNRQGGDMLGTLRMAAGNTEYTGNGQRIKLNSTGITFPNWTAFQTWETNGNTVVTAVPNGTGVNANFFVTNRSGMADFGSMSMGMVGADAVLETFNVGTHGIPNMKFNVGGTLRATLNQTGLLMSGATETIGQIDARTSGLNSYGGANAVTLGQSSQNMENYATPGFIYGLFGGAGVTCTAGNLETIARPAFAFISCIYAALKARKIM